MAWSTPPEADFEREHGCTDAEWRSWLPGAVRSHALRVEDGCGARVDIDGGTLHLAWQGLPPRRIALISMPRMQVRYRFERLTPEQRQRFMRYFDLYMQRGGG
jgi:hypothetical protein